MAKVILEVQNRGLNQYHPLDKYPVAIGRALDNDIILSDDSVSPHHLLIDQDSRGQLILHNLSTENGTFLNKQPLGQASVVADLPGQLLLGNRKLRLLSSDMPVEMTHINRCSGLMNILCHPVSAIFLFLLNIFALVANNYLETPLQKDALFYVSNLLPTLLFLLFLMLTATVVTRLVTHRWQFMPAISLVSLFSLVPLLLIEAGHLVDYFLTSDVPSRWIATGIGDFLLLPTLLFIFLRWVLHQRTQPALGIALLLSALPLGLRAVNIIDQFTADNEFSSDANYSQSLSSLNIHAGTTLNLDDYLAAAQQALPLQTEAALPNTANEKSAARSDTHTADEEAKPDNTSPIMPTSPNN